MDLVTAHSPQSATVRDWLKRGASSVPAPWVAADRIFCQIFLSGSVRILPYYCQSMASSPSSDPDLLAAWVRRRHEAAFHELVARYTPLVHQVARRTCGDDALAADVSQHVFMILARKAGSLLNHPSLAGWLHVTAVRKARDLLDQNRREIRKRQQFQAAMETHNPADEAAWQELQPILDDALAALSAADREALLLRFYRALSVREVADTLGIATAAAQKRIDRATERLRGKLIRRGCTTGASLAGVMLAGFATDAQAAGPAVAVLAPQAIAAGAVGTGVLSSISTLLTTTAMKATSAAVPLAVLLVGGVWLALQFRSIAELEDRTARLTQHLATRAKEAAKAPPAVLTALDRKPVDWAEVARQLKASRPSDPVNPGARLEQRFTAMSLEEISSSLDAIKAAGLSDENRELLEKRICEELGGPKGGPKLVLERFAGSIGKGMWPWTLGSHFKTWIDREPDQAIAWLTKNANRMGDLSPGFFPMSFYPLLATSPDTAARLLDAVPPDRRLGALSTVEDSLVSAAQKIAWAKIMRQHLPEKDRTQAVAWPTMNHSDGDGAPMSMSQITAYLKQIDASKEERAACIMVAAREHSAAGPAGHDDLEMPAWIEALRDWVKGQAPELVDRATGVALAQGIDGSIKESGDLALQYYEKSRNDDLLVPLLENTPSNDESRPLARKLAGQLSDATLRRKYLDKFKQPNP